MKKHFNHLVNYINKSKFGNFISWLVTLSLVFSALSYGTIPLIWKLWNFPLLLGIMTIAVIALYFRKSPFFQEYLSEEKFIKRTIEFDAVASKPVVKVYNFFFPYIDFVFLIYVGSHGWTLFYIFVLLVGFLYKQLLYKPFLMETYEKYTKIINKEYIENMQKGENY